MIVSDNTREQFSLPPSTSLSLSLSLCLSFQFPVELSESVAFRASEADRVPEKNLGLPGARASSANRRIARECLTQLEIRLPVEKRGSADEQPERCSERERERDRAAGNSLMPEMVVGRRYRGLPASRRVRRSSRSDANRSPASVRLSAPTPAITGRDAIRAGWMIVFCSCGSAMAQPVLRPSAR